LRSAASNSSLSSINWQTTYRDLQATFREYESRLNKSTQNKTIRDEKLALLKELAGSLLLEESGLHVIDDQAEVKACLERINERFQDMQTTFQKYRGTPLTRFFMQLIKVIGQCLPAFLRYDFPLTGGEVVCKNVSKHLPKLSYFQETPTYPSNRTQVERNDSPHSNSEDDTTPSAPYPHPIKFNRAIEAFKGEAVVVGCGHTGQRTFCEEWKISVGHKGREHPLHSSMEHYYTIDLHQSTCADLKMDIRWPAPPSLKERFKLTILEYVDCDAYNPVFRTSDHSGMQTLLDITAKEGFILIAGCPREKEFRCSIYALQLKYIELDERGQQQCVLIPKNQEATLEEVKTALKKLSPELQTTLKNAVLDSNAGNAAAHSDPLSFCSVPYEKMPVMTEESLRKEINSPTTNPKRKKRIENNIEKKHAKYLKLARTVEQPKNATTRKI
jgi:hypothetical protein